jgi:hypothetical protein
VRVRLSLSLSPSLSFPLPLWQGEWAPANVRALLDGRIRTPWNAKRRLVSLLQTRESVKPLKLCLRAGVPHLSRPEVRSTHTHTHTHTHTGVGAHTQPCACTVESWLLIAARARGTRPHAGVVPGALRARCPRYVRPTVRDPAIDKPLCVYVCMCECSCLCVFVFVFVCVCVCECLCVYVCMCVNSHACVCVRVCVWAWVLIRSDGDVRVMWMGQRRSGRLRMAWHAHSAKHD